MYTLRTKHDLPRCFYLQALSESGNTTELIDWITPKSQERVDATVNATIKILETSPETRDAITQIFRDIVSYWLNTPEWAERILTGLFEKYNKRLEALSGLARFKAITWFSDFMKIFSQNLAHSAKDTKWLGEIQLAHENFEAKSKSIWDTYHAILNQQAWINQA